MMVHQPLLLLLWSGIRGLGIPTTGNKFKKGARFGNLNEEDGQVVSFEEKAQTSGGLINGGFMIFNRHMLDYLTPNEDCDLEFGILERLASIGQVMVYKHEGLWECMDHERDVTHLNKLWNENNSFWKVWE